MPVSGPLIQQQALKFAKDLNNDTFKESNGWLDSLLKKNNIVFRTVTVERGDVDTSTVDDWKKNLPALCEGYRPEDLYDMDEQRWCFHETTNKGFHTKGEDCAGGKQSKERITLALTASMMGEKLNPLVIGKAQKPMCFAFNLCFIFTQIKQWKNGMQSMHPYENSISSQPSE